MAVNTKCTRKKGQPNDVRLSYGLFASYSSTFRNQFDIGRTLQPILMNPSSLPSIRVGLIPHLRSPTASTRKRVKKHNTNILVSWPLCQRAGQDDVHALSTHIKARDVLSLSASVSNSSWSVFTCSNKNTFRFRYCGGSSPKAWQRRAVDQTACNSFERGMVVGHHTWLPLLTVLAKRDARDTGHTAKCSERERGKSENIHC